MNNQNFKVGQKVKVHEGLNHRIDLLGETGVVCDVDHSAPLQPNIRVCYGETVKIWAYPDPFSGIKFNVEILEDVQTTHLPQ